MTRRLHTVVLLPLVRLRIALYANPTRRPDLFMDFARGPPPSQPRKDRWRTRHKTIVVRDHVGRDGYTAVKVHSDDPGQVVACWVDEATEA